MSAGSTVWTPQVGRVVYLRDVGSDRTVWADTFSGLYHVPPVPIWPETVLDLGANIGLTAAHYEALWPSARIVAVEMDEACCELARTNAPGTRVRCCAVNGTGGWGTYDPSLRAEAFRLEPIQPGHRSSPVVEAVPLAQIIVEEFPGGCAEFVKMDVEGAEWSILENAAGWVPLVGAVLIELHPIDEMPNDSDWLVAVALAKLAESGMVASRHERHPRAVWAVK